MQREGFSITHKAILQNSLGTLSFLGLLTDPATPSHYAFRLTSLIVLEPNLPLSAGFATIPNCLLYLLFALPLLLALRLCQGNARPICPALGRLASSNMYIISPSLTLPFPLRSQSSLYPDKPTLIVCIP
jgi:hypothetical protein